MIYLFFSLLTPIFDYKTQKENSMHITEMSDLRSWLRNDLDRRAVCQWIPDNDDLKQAIRMGGIKVKKTSKNIGAGMTFEEFEFLKSDSFKFDYDTGEYIY